MGYQKLHRPLDARVRGTSGATATADGVRAWTGRFDNEHTQSFQSASSAATTIGPRGVALLATASSAGFTSPIVVYLDTPSSGDLLRVGVKALAASSNTISLRTESSATYISGSTAVDSLLFEYPDQSATLFAVSSAQWVLLTPVSTGAPLSTAGTALATRIPPILVASSS